MMLVILLKGGLKTNLTILNLIQRLFSNKDTGTTLSTTKVTDQPLSTSVESGSAAHRLLVLPSNLVKNKELVSTLLSIGFTVNLNLLIVGRWKILDI